MPTYRGISILLQSQYEARQIPEFPPPCTAAVPSPQRNEPDASFSAYSPAKLSPESPRTAEVYVPIYSGSQFWIVFSCPEPGASETRFYYFKLYVDGRCLLSWGSGEEDNWSGRVTFGIFDGGQDFYGHQILEKRAFFFANESQGEERGGSFEIRIFRSKARKREETKHQSWERGAEGNGISVQNAGRLRKGEPKRSYVYALLDPKDKPYAVFKYHCQTGKQLADLGVKMPDDCEDFEDITTASPSKRAIEPVIVHSPPPKEQPAPAPGNFLAKDSVGMRRRLSRQTRVRFAVKPQSSEISPTKKSQHLQQESVKDWDAFKGLTLADARDTIRTVKSPAAAATSSHAKPDEKPTRSGNPIGLFNGMKRHLSRRGGSREEQKSEPL